MLKRRSQISSAIGLESAITKSGYLVKRAKRSQSNWRKRYFVLNGNTLTYYKDHKSTNQAKGDLLLTADAMIAEVTDPQYPFSFDITTPFMSLRLASTTEQERNEWRASIENTIVQVAHSLRGYLMKRGGMGNAWQKKFFILHRDSITYHLDHDHTSKIQGMVRFASDTTLDIDREARTITIRSNDKELALQVPTYTDLPDDFPSWVAGINSSIEKLRAAGIATRSTDNRAFDGEDIKRGYLKTRPAKGGDVWPDQYFVLTAACVYVFEDENSVDASELYPITPSCSVFETNLKPHAFELVTAQKVLHVQGASDAETCQWIMNLRQVISNSRVNDDDPLLRAAIEKAQSDTFYDVTFRDKKPLGVVLERSGEWAVVKLSNFEETSVSIGSALYAINRDVVVLRPYMETIRMLTGWKPPLTLGFRRAPEKRGWLTKQARARRANFKNWKPRYFILCEGRLSYYDNDNPDAEMKVSGITSLVMQGLTVDDMMDWASTLYHAIAVANGGAHLLDIERNKVKMELAAQEEARERAEQERIKAEEERVKAEAETAKAEEERAQAEEERAKAEEERAKAEEERAKAEEERVKAEEERVKAEQERAKAEQDERERLALEAAEAAERAEQERLAAEEARKRQQDALEAQRRAEEAQRKAEEALRVAVEEEEKRKAEEEMVAAAQATAAAAAAEEEARRLQEDQERLRLEAEEEAKRLFEAAEERRKDEEAKRKEEELQRQVEEEARQREEEAKQREEEARQKEEEARQQEEEARQQEEEVRQKEEEAKQKEEEAKQKELHAQLEAQREMEVEVEQARLLEERLEKEREEVSKMLPPTESNAEEDDDDDDDEYSDEGEAQKPPAQELEIPHAEPASADVTSNDAMSSEVSYTDAHEAYSRHTESVDVEDEIVDNKLHQVDLMNNQELEKIFLKLAAGHDNTRLNAMQFSGFIRLVTGQHNLFKEMKLFHRFDLEGDGVITSENFVAGVKRLLEELGHDNWLEKGLSKFSGEGVVL